MSGNISTIDSTTFEPFPNLVDINLDGNRLVSLDGEIFKHTRKVGGVWFNNNGLQHVGHDLLNGLTDLTWAAFQSNPCIHAYAHTPEAIQELKLRLQTQCPPSATPPDPPTTTISTTSEPNECPESCTSNEQTQEIYKRMEEMERQMRDETKARMEDAQEMKEMIAELQRQLTKLENVVKEIQIPI